MVGIHHIKINARNVGEIISVFMSLNEKMPTIVVSIRRTARIVIENQISVFIRLSATTIIQVAECRDHARWVLEYIGALLNELGGELRLQYVGRDRNRIC